MNVNKEILAKLAKLEADITYLKEYLEDTSLTGEDIEALRAYHAEKKEGKFISHKQLKKELGL